MAEHLEREQRIADIPAPNGARDALDAFMEQDDRGLPPEVEDLIKRCLDGTEPVSDAERRSWHNDKFNSRCVHVAMLRAAGFKNHEIASALDYTQAWVSSTLSHPYSRKIIHAMLSARGTRVLDIRTKLDEYASDVLDQMYDLTKKSQDLELVTKVGFGLLDRAGYNATQKVQQVPAAQGMASEGTLSRLANALEQSNVVDAHIIPAYIPKPPPEDQSRGLGSADEGRDSSTAPAGSGSGLSGEIKLARVSE